MIKKLYDITDSHEFEEIVVNTASQTDGKQFDDKGNLVQEGKGIMGIDKFLNKIDFRSENQHKKT